MILCDTIYRFSYDDFAGFHFWTGLVLALIIFILILPFLRRRFRSRYANTESVPPLSNGKEKWMDMDASDALHRVVSPFRKIAICISLYVGSLFFIFLLSLIIVGGAAPLFKADVIVAAPNEEAIKHQIVWFHNDYGVCKKGDYVCNRTEEPVVCALVTKRLGTPVSISVQKVIAPGETVEVTQLPECYSIDTKTLARDIIRIRGDYVTVLMPERLIPVKGSVCGMLVK